METLTLDRAITLAKEVVADFGAEYVYPEADREFHNGTNMCKYVANGKPSCLVGQILHRHGVSIEALSEQEFRSSYRVTPQVTEVEEKALNFLVKLQSEQDESATWGNALNYALQGYTDRSV